MNLGSSAGEKPYLGVHQTSSSSLIALQTEYVAWLDALPEALQGTATSDALQATADLDLDDLTAIERSTRLWAGLSDKLADDPVQHFGAKLNEKTLTVIRD